MWLFKKKERLPEPIEPPPCKHKYQDFPMYLVLSYYSNIQKAIIGVYEPYVCIYCKKRINRCLEETEYGQVDYEAATALLALKQKELGDKVKPQFEVEDMVNDFQLVDREWLKLAALVRNKNQPHNE
jgi:hypothetical protein